MGMEKDPDASKINDTLSGIKIVSIACVLVGIGSIVCGSLVLGFTNPVWQYPYSTCSGIWAGGVILALGTIGLVLILKYDFDQKAACMRWLAIFRGLAQATWFCGGQHFIYTIVGVVLCGVRSENKHGEEKCNVDNHDRLIIVNGCGVAFGVLMIILGMGSIIYISRCHRWQTLTGGESYRGHCCGRKC